MYLHPSSVRVAAGVWLATLAMSLPAIRSASAAPPVLLWGFERGCAPLPEVAREVEKKLHTQSQDVGLLQTPKGQPLPPCTGERCAQALRAACPVSAGRILGGQVVSSRFVVKSRLWLYDLGTGQIAYQDDYCQSCDLALGSALSAQARHLIDHPTFGATPGPAPGYCSAARSPASSEAQRIGPLLLTVYGQGSHKAALNEALVQQLTKAGRPPQPVLGETKGFGGDELKKIVAGQKGAQVLGVHVPKDGKLQIFLYDGPTENLEFKTVNCAECQTDKDMLLFRVQQEVVSLLEHCFGWQCADPSARPAGAAPPPEACEPFPEQVCPGADLLVSTAGLPIVSSGHIIDPSTAKVIKGLTWGAFAISTATAIGLFVADSTAAGTRIDTNGMQIQHQLNYPAWSATGLGALILGVAIPATIVVNRATRQTAKPSAGAASTVFQCPSL